MINIIKKPYTVIWLPFASLTTIAFLFWLCGINFAQSIFNFIVGEAYDIIAIIISCLWLCGTCWGMIAYLNKDVFASNSSESEQKQGSLYKITTLRDNALKHVSATKYNIDSLNIIRQYNPTSQLLPKEKPEEGDKSKEPIEQEATSKESEVPDKGEKKSETSQPPEPKPSTTSAKSHSSDSAKKGATYATVNTAIKGESFATDDTKAKYTEMLKKIAEKRKYKVA